MSVTGSGGLPRPNWTDVQLQQIHHQQQASSTRDATTMHTFPILDGSLAPGQLAHLLGVYWQVMADHTDDTSTNDVFWHTWAFIGVDMEAEDFEDTLVIEDMETLLAEQEGAGYPQADEEVEAGTITQNGMLDYCRLSAKGISSGGGTSMGSYRNTISPGADFGIEPGPIYQRDDDITVQQRHFFGNNDGTKDLTQFVQATFYWQVFDAEEAGVDLRRFL